MRQYEFDLKNETGDILSMTQVTLKGVDVELHGSFLREGNLAPDFVLVNQEMETITLESYKERRKLIAIVPSIDTSVCSEETIKLNELAVMNPHFSILVVSKDLPFAHDRFCKSANIDNITLLADIRPSSNFAKDYGVQIGSGPLEGLLTRAILVLNEHDKVIYSELVPEITQIPNLDLAFKMMNESPAES